MLEVHKLLVAAPGTYSSCAVLNSTLLQHLPPDYVLVVAKASAFLWEFQLQQRWLAEVIFKAFPQARFKVWAKRPTCKEVTYNHRGSLHLLHNATGEGLNHLISLQFGWRRTCESVYFHSSRNEELTCSLSRIPNQHSVAYLTLSWASCPGVQKQSRLRVLSVESKRFSRVQRAIRQKGTMDLAFIVDQAEVGRWAVGSLRSIWEMMKLAWSVLTKTCWLQTVT